MFKIKASLTKEEKKPLLLRNIPLEFERLSEIGEFIFKNDKSNIVFVVKDNNIHPTLEPIHGNTLSEEESILLAEKAVQAWFSNQFIKEINNE